MTRSHTKGMVALLVVAFLQFHAAAKEPLTFRVDDSATGNDNDNGANDNAKKTDTGNITLSTRRHVFRIVQLADLHWGEFLDTEKGKNQNDQTAHAIQVYLETEQPDFVVLSGDQISSDFVPDKSAGEIHGQVIATMQRVFPDIKWCTIMGNHDDHPYEVIKNGKIVKEINAKTSRKEMLEYDSTWEGSYTQPGELSNYAIPLYLEDGSSAADIYLFDTGGGALPKELSEDQVEWFKNVSKEQNIAIPAIGFMHIPTRKGFEFKDGCVGEDSEEVRMMKNKPGILEAIVEQGHTHLLGVGHNHGNDYCCSHDKPLHLCFGRHSGYGGYEGVSRGARVYELELSVNDDARTRTFSWSTWVRLDTGEKTNEYKPDRSYDYTSPQPPTHSPTNGPTMSLEPSAAPSVSWQPSILPTQTPSSIPSAAPSNIPSILPSSIPTIGPSLSPSTAFPTTTYPELTTAEPSTLGTAIELPPSLRIVQTSSRATSEGVKRKTSLFYSCCLGAVLLLMF